MPDDHKVIKALGDDKVVIRVYEVVVEKRPRGHQIQCIRRALAQLSVHSCLSTAAYT